MPRQYPTTRSSNCNCQQDVEITLNLDECCHHPTENHNMLGCQNRSHPISILITADASPCPDTSNRDAITGDDASPCLDTPPNPEDTPPNPEIDTIIKTFGEPYIVQDDVVYYFGAWGPGTTFLRIDHQKQNVSFQSGYIDESDLHDYVPLFIEMLKDLTQGGTGQRALAYLATIMRLEFPNGYGDYYMHPTENSFTCTPFEDIYPVLDNTTYQQWKQWWETEHHILFLPKEE